jgi:SAM-dependent methyltransferase
MLNVYGMLLLGAAVFLFYSRFKNRSAAFFISIAAAFLFSQFPGIAKNETVNIRKLRNYYGIYRIYDKEGKRYFAHGTTIHGAQYLDKTRQNIPLLYFHNATPIGEVMAADSFKFKNIGIVGLGIGVLASYYNPGQNIDYFEIDPDVYSLATQYSAYLKNSRGKINYVIGDARLSLKKIENNKYDILVIDAFSGDSIPLHLITTDAINEYRRCIKKDGLILFHISNRYLNLSPVLAANSNMLAAYSARKLKLIADDKGAASSEWCEITWNKENQDILVSRLGWSDMKNNPGIKKIRPWTDDYSSITPIVKFSGLMSNLISFNLK